MRGEGFERVLGGVCAPGGFLASGVHCGIKEGGQADLALLYSELPSAAAGVFTTNDVKAAPVVLSAERIKGGSARGLVINSGNANALTGERGMADARGMAAAAERALGLAEGQFLVASTGVIGEYLPIEKVVKGIEHAVLELSPGGNTDAAKAIMTTDSYPKELAVEMEVGDRVARIGAMAKGAGMIQPELATMIAVITTDLPLQSELMQDWLEQACEWSFNRTSVDGCRSTNDTVFMLANGGAFPGGHALSGEESDLVFRALCWLTAHLAMALVKDGEGASRLIRIVVNGARDDGQAVEVARAIACSNLVKCAFSGGLAPAGRIAAAAGSARVGVDSERLGIFLGEHPVVSGGRPSRFDRSGLEEYLGRDEIEVTVELGLGEGSAYFLTTDLTADYVRLNSEARS